MAMNFTGNFYRTLYLLNEGWTLKFKNTSVSLQKNFFRPFSVFNFLFNGQNSFLDLSNPNSEDVISNGAACGGGNAVAVCHNNNNNNKTSPSSIYSTLPSSSSSYQTTSSSSRLTKNYNAGSSTIPKNYRKTNVVGAWPIEENGILSENGHIPTNIYDDDDDDYRQYGSPSSYLSTIIGWFNVFAWKLLGINSLLPVNARALDTWTPSSSSAAVASVSADYCRDSDEESGESKDSVDSNNTNTVVDGRSFTTKKGFNSAVKFRGGKTRRKNLYASSSLSMRNDNIFDGGASSTETMTLNFKDLNNVGQTAEQKEKVQDKDLYLRCVNFFGIYYEFRIVFCALA